MARAIVFNGTNLELVQKEVPEPAPGHVVVRITIRPILYVDLIRHAHIFEAIGKPVVPGYEGFGIVHSVRILTHFCMNYWNSMNFWGCWFVWSSWLWVLHDWWDESGWWAVILQLIRHLPTPTISQATSNRVPWEEHGTYPLNPKGHNVIDRKFVCPMIEGNYHGTTQSEMHQIWEFVSSGNYPSQSKRQFQLFNNDNTIILLQNMMAPPHLTLSPPV